MISPPLYNTHHQTTSSVAFYYRLWAAHKVELRRVWHAIIAFGQHIRSNDVGCGMQASPLGRTRSKDVGRGMTSPPLDSANGRMTSGATCHHVLWKAHTVKRRQAWHAIITLGQHKRSDGVGRGIPSSPLGSTHGRTTSGVACIIAFGQHTRSNDIGRGIPSWPLDSTHGRTTSSVAYHHSP